MIKLRSISFLIFLFPVIFSATAQKQKVIRNNAVSEFHRCGTQSVMNELMKKYPSLGKETELNRKQAIQDYEKFKQSYRLEAIYTIPVVVHVVLSSPGSVSDVQIQSQIDVLNADFAGLNSDSTRIPAAFKPLYGKGNIRFCLAKRDPKGDATNGINRITSYVLSSPGLEDPVKFTCTGGSDAWDPKKYLNIWVCQMPSGFLGYSFYASDPLSIVPLNERGFVNSYRSFGKAGTSQAPYNLGRTGTHEIGHFFDLTHIWGPNNCDDTQSCTDDDGLNDTPKQFKCTFGAPRADSIIVDACTATAPGIMWMNYMDYVDDRAMVMYTPQQYSRMEAVLIANPWMQTLITSNGCSPVPTFSRDVRFEKFKDLVFDVCGTNSSIMFSCSSNYKPVVTIKNIGTTTISSLNISAKFGNGTAVVTNWTGTLSSQASIDITLNSMNLIAGTNSNLVVYSSNPNGSVDENVFNDTGKLSAVVYPIVTVPYSEGFEGTTFAPTNWQRFNPNNDITWQRTTTASKSGFASMFINNYDYSANNLSDLMFSPIIPVKGKDSAFLTFQVAAATYSLPDLANNPTDTLEVLITSDCGLTYQSVYKKWGKELVTTGNIGVDTSYVPIASQWRSETVFLGDFSSGSTESIQAVFKNTTNFENNIYIDDVNLFVKEVNPNLKRKGVMITPNPFKDKFVLQYYQRPVNLEYINIYNHIGQLVWQKRISLGIGGTNLGPNYLEIDLGSLNSGMYNVQLVYRSKKTETLRIIKIN